MLGERIRCLEQTSWVQRTRPHNGVFRRRIENDASLHLNAGYACATPTHQPSAVNPP